MKGDDSLPLSRDQSRPSSRIDQEFLSPTRRHPYYLERRSLAIALRELAVHVQHGRILDVGCGFRPYEAILSNAQDRYIGIDYPVTMKQSYNAVTRAHAFADCRRLPIYSSACDTVVSTQVLEHVSEPGQFLAELARVLRPEGVLILSAPMTWPLHEEPYDYFRYTQHGGRHLLRGAGFEILAEIQRGGTMSTLGQMFLETHLRHSGAASLLRRVYHNALAITVNTGFSALARVLPDKQLCLGWAWAARKQG